MLQIDPLKLTKYFRHIFSVILVTTCLWVSFGDAVKTAFSLLGVLKNQNALLAMTNEQDVRRKIQQQFSRLGIHLPTEFIFVTTMPAHQDYAVQAITVLGPDQLFPNLERTKNYHQKICGKNAKIFLWIPFRVRLPYLGYKYWHPCIGLPIKS